MVGLLRHYWTLNRQFLSCCTHPQGTPELQSCNSATRGNPLLSRGFTLLHRCHRPNCGKAFPHFSRLCAEEKWVIIAVNPRQVVGTLGCCSIGGKRGKPFPPREPHVGLLRQGTANSSNSNCFEKRRLRTRR